MRRICVIVLLALLPFQFSWSAVASYCDHETQVGAGHFGHHVHQHDADTGLDTDAASTSDGTSDTSIVTKADKSLGATDLDCGHCHGYCSAMLSAPPGVPLVFAAGRPKTSLTEGGATRAPTQPERPQWSPLA